MIDQLPCPWCAIQGVRIYPRVESAWLMSPTLVCSRCQPNWRVPALWRRVVRAFIDWVRG